MTDQEIQEQAEKYAIDRGADKDKKAFRIITNRDLYDHTIECFEAGAKWMQENKCRHRLVSAKNDIIQDGFFCVDCGELFGEYKQDVTPPKD